MEELMVKGWHFELYRNKLGSYTAIATKDEVEIITDHFRWWPLIQAIVEKVDEFQLEKARSK